MSHQLTRDKQLREDVHEELREMFTDARASSEWSSEYLAGLMTRIILDGLVEAAIERQEKGKAAGVHPVY
jgi:hypothetical protein